MASLPLSLPPTLFPTQHPRAPFNTHQIPSLLVLKVSNSFPQPLSKSQSSQWLQGRTGPAPVFFLTPSNSLPPSYSMLRPHWLISFLKYLSRGGVEWGVPPQGLCTGSLLYQHSLPQIYTWQGPASSSHMYSNTTFPDHHIQHLSPEPCPPLFSL